ncbi:A disintegrin and metalloproteinase with thrombospondin motifs 18 isoform X1 [Drosophila tropicalis]|uniref:A disintegrin and metalloproteinase with thrombospondin motifs 18 isoform X1 n=1 Tax=Drosophila tropicalis TaxID=46794 RepID=UPI0035ABD7FC
MRAIGGPNQLYQISTLITLATFISAVASVFAPIPSSNDDSIHIKLRRQRSLLWHGIELDENKLPDLLMDHERALIFGLRSAKEEAPEFKLVHWAQHEKKTRKAEEEQQQQQQQRPKRRHSRSISVQATNVDVNDANDDHHHIGGADNVDEMSKGKQSGADDDVEAKLQLQQSPQLIDDAFIFIRSTPNGTEFVEHSPELLKQLEKCFYRGPSSAVNLCEAGSVHGVFQQNASDFVIHPLPNRFGAGLHVIYQARSLPNNNNNNVTPSDIPVQFEPDLEEFNEPRLSRRRSHMQTKVQGLRLRFQPRHHHGAQHRRRRRRYIGPPPRRWPVPEDLNIETAIFTDSHLYRHMERNFGNKDAESKLIQYVLTILNGVQLLYHHATLGRRINFVLKRLVVWKYSNPPDLELSRDVDTYLNNFCKWQEKFNPESNNEILHYDHALLLTGLDLLTIGKNGQEMSQVVGLAPVSGMCTATSSCTVNEGKNFDSVFVVAHEIGHNLGLRHDSQENQCDSTMHIMSPTLGRGKVTWSKCSRDYLEQFLTLPQADCLFQRGNLKGLLDHTAGGKLPGEIFDANQQCMLKYGKGSERATQQSRSQICLDLHCQIERFTKTSHPALEGTECGDNMWCRGGFCVFRRNPQHSSGFNSLSQLSAASSAAVSGGKNSPSHDKASFMESSTSMSQLLHMRNDVPGLSSWSSWSEPGACESGCLYGPSQRLREGSTGLRTFSRSCLNYHHRCMGRDRRFESCIAKNCYHVPVQTIKTYASQVCQKARKSDSELTGEGQQLVSTVEESCKVFCLTKNNNTKSRRWIFPDGTTCRTKYHTQNDIGYCIAGRCEIFSCDNSTSNFFKMDNAFCEDRFPRKEESKQQSTYKRYADRQTGITPRNRNENEVTFPDSYTRKSSYDKYNNHIERTSPPASPPPPMPAPASLVSLERQKHDTEWLIKSGCHSNCMTESKGIQVVSSRYTGAQSFQLCSHKSKPCETLQTASEFAEQTCARYKMKVRGLSGHGTQISASIDEPDRSCRVGCQAEFIKYRYYLVNGKNGHFPLGTRCSQIHRRYCVYGKCLEFGEDNLPLQQSHISLALLRSRRDTRTRKKRSFLYYEPVNITETITQDFLNSIVSNLMDAEREPIELSPDNIEFTQPIHISMDELNSHNNYNNNYS